MEEGNAFVYWLVWLLGLAFCILFPAYVIKTRGKGMRLLGVCICVTLLFLILPMIAIGMLQESLPALMLSYQGSNFEAPSITMLVGSIHKMATLDQVYFVLAAFFTLVGIGQSIFSAWLLYVRHNRISLFRAIRLMWSSAMMVVLAGGLTPMLVLNRQGISVALNSSVFIAAYIAILIGITAYLRMNSSVKEDYPLIPKRGKAKA